MRKISLDLDSLEVESFATAERGAEVRGTVRAYVTRIWEASCAESCSGPYQGSKKSPSTFRGGSTAVNYGNFSRGAMDARDGARAAGAVQLRESGEPRAAEAPVAHDQDAGRQGSARAFAALRCHVLAPWPSERASGTASSSAAVADLLLDPQRRAADGAA